MTLIQSEHSEVHAKKERTKLGGSHQSQKSDTSNTCVKKHPFYEQHKKGKFPEKTVKSKKKIRLLHANELIHEKAYMRKESLCSPRVDPPLVVESTACKLTSLFNSGSEVVPGTRFSPISRSASALSTSLLDHR